MVINKLYSQTFALNLPYDSSLALLQIKRPDLHIKVFDDVQLDDDDVLSNLCHTSCSIN